MVGPRSGRAEHESRERQRQAESASVPRSGAERSGRIYFLLG